MSAGECLFTHLADTSPLTPEKLSGSLVAKCCVHQLAANFACLLFGSVNQRKQLSAM